MNIHTITLDHNGRRYALTFDGGRVALSDDVDGKLYVGALTGLSHHIPSELALRLSVEKAKAERPMVRCADCGSEYSRITFARLALVTVRERIEVRQCHCRSCVAAPGVE